MRPLGAWDGPRTEKDQRRSRWAFKAPWSSTLDLLERELAYLDAGDVVIEADFREQDLRLDGAPRSNARQPVDPGVRISFDSKHGPLVYAADTCAFWQHNVRSIALGLEALRAVDRYGITRRAEQYTGWKQIGGSPSSALVPPAPLTRHRAAEILADAAYPRFAAYGGHARPSYVRDILDGTLSLSGVALSAQRTTHPDTGGSADAFQRVQDAIAVLRGGR